jgi:hypothetical protein
LAAQGQQVALVGLLNLLSERRAQAQVVTCALLLDQLYQKRANRLVWYRLPVVLLVKTPDAGALLTFVAVLV